MIDVPCLMNQFSCENKKCVPITSVCNEVDDCGDNSDEYCPGDMSLPICMSYWYLKQSIN